MQGVRLWRLGDRRSPGAYGDRAQQSRTWQEARCIACDDDRGELE
jgi:hypothetical protein